MDKIKLVKVLKIGQIGFLCLSLLCLSRSMYSIYTKNNSIENFVNNSNTIESINDNHYEQVIFEDNITIDTTNLKPGQYTIKSRLVDLNED